MGKYITLPQDKYPKPTQEEVLKAIAEMSYKSPIEIVVGEVKTKFEDDAMSVIHSYGICVDKEELVKALQYDRNQYKQGFVDGCRVDKGKIRAEVAREIFEEIYEDCFDQFGYIDYEALAELKKKYTEGYNYD